MKIINRNYAYYSVQLACWAVPFWNSCWLVVRGFVYLFDNVFLIIELSNSSVTSVMKKMYVKRLMVSMSFFRPYR